MADIQQFPSENGVSPQERGTSTQPFVLAQGPTSVSQLIPWSRYVPFAKGSNLTVEGKIFLLPLGIPPIPFSGNATIDELTDTQLGFSVRVPPVKLPDIFNFDSSEFDDFEVTAQIKYVEEGGKNSATFKISGLKEQQTNISIQSKLDERILTIPGGLRFDLPFKVPVIPNTIEVKELHLLSDRDRVDLKVVMGPPVPDFTISVFKQ